MKIGLYDTVLLTNGNKAAIIEILEIGSHYLADVHKPDIICTEVIRVEEISGILFSADDEWSPKPEDEPLFRQIMRYSGRKSAKATVGQMNAAYHSVLEWDRAGRPFEDD